LTAGELDSLFIADKHYFHNYYDRHQLIYTKHRLLHHLLYAPAVMNELSAKVTSSSVKLFFFFCNYSQII